MDHPERIRRQLVRSLANWKRRRAGLKPGDSMQIAMTEDIIKVYHASHFSTSRVERDDGARKSSPDDRSQRRSNNDSDGI
jgi:hypothetical protein